MTVHVLRCQCQNIGSDMQQINQLTSMLSGVWDDVVSQHIQAGDIEGIISICSQLMNTIESPLSELVGIEARLETLENV